MQFAEMADGLFIFDEIHAYDPHATALILTMLERLCREYAAQFCIMTTAMPGFLRRMFMKVLDEATEVEMPSEQHDKFTRHPPGEEGDAYRQPHQDRLHRQGGHPARCEARSVYGDCP